jgi:lipoate---protein ligase
MNVLDLSLSSLAENLALDEALLLHAEADGPEVLRLWQWHEHAVILGAGGKLADDVNEDACRADGVPIMRRSSGGGTVLLGPGCLLFSLILRFDRDPALSDLHASYRFILGRVQAALEPLVGSITQQGISDLAFNDRKFSGNAQQRKRTHLLHHGTLLYGFDFAPLDRYLKRPARQPQYRRDRRHCDFLVNLPIPRATLEQCLRDAWNATPARSVSEDFGQTSLTRRVIELVDQLIADRYSRSEWIRRR